MKKTAVPFCMGLIITASIVGLSGCGTVKPAMLKVSSGATASQSQEDQLTFTGKLSGINEVQIVSKISGRVSKVFKDIGDTVSAGDVLVTLETTDLQAQLDSAKSNLNMAQAKLASTTSGTRAEDIAAAKAAYEGALQKYQDAKNGTRPEQIAALKASVAAAEASYEDAKNKLDRTKALYDAGAASQQSYDDMQAQYSQAQAQYQAAQDNLQLAQQGPTQASLNALQAAVDQAKAAYDKAVNGPTRQDIQQAQAAVSQAQSMVNLNQYNLDNATIKSPIKGIVAARNIDPGELANPQAALLTIADIDQVYLSIDVPEDQLKSIKLNQSVDVSIDAIGKTVKGKIAIISPQAESGTDKYLVKVLIDNSDHSLLSGMTATAKISQSK